MKRKPVTIKDIAHRLGISYSTVSRALSPHVSHLVKEQTRRDIQQAAEEMNYAPNLMARTLLKGEGGILGLSFSQVNLESFGKLIHHFLRLAGENGYQVLIAATVDRLAHSPGDNQVNQIKQLESRGVEGLLVNARGDEAESARIAGAVKGKLPMASCYYPVGDMNGVVLDYAYGFFEMTEHLIGLGHERICFLGDDWVRTCGSSSMGKGYYKAMRKHGLTPRRAEVDPIRTESGYRLAKKLRNRFTALVCCCDNTAIGVCRGLADLEINVPEEVAVTGCGDMAISAYTTPALTTLIMPYEDIARIAIEDILGQLQDSVPPRHHILKPQMIIRESCGAG